MSDSPLVTQARAFSEAQVPTSALILGLAHAVACELANSMQGTVTITLPGRVVIIRNPGDSGIAGGGK